MNEIRKAQEIVEEVKPYLEEDIRWAIEKLIYFAKKSQWHDLTLNKFDLPINFTKIYIIKTNGLDGEQLYFATYNWNGWYCYGSEDVKLETVIAWKEID